MNGYLVFNDKEYFFNFDNFILSIIPNNNYTYVQHNDKIFFNTREAIADIIYGEIVDTQQKIYFINSKKIERNYSSGTYKFEVNLYIILNDENIDIEAISIYCNELNWFYNVNKSYDCMLDNNMKNINLNLNKPIVNIFNFKCENVDIESKLLISTNLVTMSTNPVTLSTNLKFTFNVTKELTFIISLINLAKQFLWVVAYRNNINITKVELQRKNNDGYYKNCGHIFINNEMDSFIEPENVVKEQIIDYDLLKDTCGNIFQLLSDKVIYLEHIPYNSRDRNITTPSRFILITAAFEWEFKHIYGDVKTDENSNFKELKDELLKFIDDKIDNLTTKRKDFMKKYRKIIGNSDMSLSQKILRTLKDNKNVIDIFIAHLYSINNIKDIKYKDIAERIQTQRNNYAHGNIDKKLDALVILDLFVLELIIYTMILKEAGLDDNSIQQCINKLFNLNIYF